MGFEIKTSSGHTIKSQSGALRIFEDGLNELLRPLENEMKMALVPILNETKKIGHTIIEEHEPEKTNHIRAICFISNHQRLSKLETLV